MNELSVIFTWWFTFFILGIIGIPTSYILFKNFKDCGYGFSKIISLLVISYIAFILSVSKIFLFNKFLVFFSLGIYLTSNLLIFLKIKGGIFTSVKKALPIIFFQEFIFSLGLVGWAKIRGFHPQINGLEKFMDFGFINSILKSQFLPPSDMWYAGESINYYWFGHLTTSVATLLSNIPSSITYNLMIATILGFTLTTSFSIITTLTEKTENKTKAVIAAGLISAILLTFAGNFHTPIYALKEGADSYWYPDATRFIGYNPETNDKTIHEFPIYSFVVSDLHAHLLNLPFVLLYIALLFKFLSRLHFIENWKLKNSIRFTVRKLPRLVTLGFVLGVMFMTNTWDFGNYLLLSVIAIFVFYFKKKGFWDAVFYTPLISTALLISALVFASPFILNFDSIAKGIDFVNARTPLWQLAVLWGFPLLMTLVFALTAKKLWPKLKKVDLFILCLLITSWLLIILPEIIFVKDIYIASHHRANTMFKLTYQSFVMSYLASGYITIRALSLISHRISKFFVSLGFVSIFASILWYPYVAVKTYYQELKIYKGLNGETWLAENYPGIYGAVAWLRKSEGNPVILEAPGDSYTEYNVISSYSGLPTVSGWFVHEWLWRGSSDIPQTRVNDIQEIYTSENPERSAFLLKKYGVKYVIVGPFEHDKFPDLKDLKFKKIGREVFSSGNTKVYQVY